MLYLYGYNTNNLLFHINYCRCTNKLIVQIHYKITHLVQQLNNK